ncbi:hypothetical protein BEN47_14795 [Hymenobacter lapidarius]|uniref:ABC transmembrane type-1 domain-containing protein n=1 Tax=Hymenobacter lapidarius TaxID=1908237 RepID=A0A1G1T3P4_9BACT|nr:ABC transporter permease [Hymenobacter lapidarius]OGX85472.1 hypothetical protein BEN47_14795 [Hymenobacter lapidarius]
MVGLVFRRLAQTGLAVWALASVVFLLSYRDLDAAVRLALPDATEATAGPGAGRAADQATRQAAFRQRLGLDLPLFYLSRTTDPQLHWVKWRWNGAHNQYHRWATGLVRGNWGVSFRTGEAVTARLGRALSFTLPLTGTAAFLAVLCALGLGQRLARRPWGHSLLQAALVGLHALPLFVVALALLLTLANPEVVAWFPAYGLSQATDADLDTWSQTGRYALHLVLPVAALTLTALPELTLHLSGALARELRSDYATTARAKGLAEPAIIRHHALRNALLPTITLIAELLPALVAGAVVVEVVFALPGMGRLLADAAAARDYPVLVGGILLIGAARLLALLLADLLYFWADPRIRWHS